MRDDVLEADVESAVFVRGEGEAVLARYVAGPRVVVANRVFDLPRMSANNSG